MPKNTDASFTASIDALEGILNQFKQDTPTLETALKLFEQGVGHIRVCQTELTTAKGRVDELLSSLQNDNTVLTQPFDA